MKLNMFLDFQGSCDQIIMKSERKKSDSQNVFSDFARVASLGQVILIHSEQVDGTGSSTLI